MGCDAHRIVAALREEEVYFAHCPLGENVLTGECEDTSCLYHSEHGDQEKAEETEVGQTESFKKRKAQRDWDTG